MGHIITSLQQPPKDKKSWLNFKRNRPTRPSFFAITAWTLSIVLLCHLDAMAQPCNPLINGIADGGELNICVNNLSLNVSPDNPPINNLTEGMFTSTIPPANFMTSNNTATVMAGTPPGSYSITYEVTTDLSGDCTVGETTTITLHIEGDVSIMTQPTNAMECAGDPSSFSVVANDASGTATLTYQWQVSTDNGVNFNDISNGTLYSGANMSTLMIDDVTGLNNFEYQVIVSILDCADAVISNPAVLTVEGMSIVTQPMDTDGCEGSSVTFSVVADNGGAGTPTYQWEFSTDGGTNYMPVPDNAIYDNVTTDNLLVNDVTSLGGNLYRVDISIAASLCPPITSNEALLIVESPISISMQPMDITECSGNNTSFSATIDNPTAAPVIYQWQVSMDGITYTNVPDNVIYDDVTTTTLLINDVAGLGGNFYQLEISSVACPTQLTMPATLTVEGPIVIDNEPIDVIECAGSATSFNVMVTNMGSGMLTYQWEVSIDGGTNYMPVPDDSTYDDVNTETLIIHDVINLNANLYRLQISNTACGFQTSDAALLTVEGPLTISNHPTDVTDCAGSSASFSTMVTNGGGGTITYQWEVSSNGFVFNDVPDNAIYDNVTSSTLIINDIADLNGMIYRAKIISTACALQTTNSATLTVDGALVIATQPIDVTGCAGTSADFSVSVTNNGAGTLTYQWQVSNDGGTNYTNVPDNVTYDGEDSPDLIVHDLAGLDGNLYRLEVNGTSCGTRLSDAAMLTVHGAITITSQPMDMVECAGNPTTFTVGVTNDGSGTIAYQWQFSNNGGTNYMNVPDDADYDNVNTPILVIHDVTNFDSYFYRLEISGTTCPTQISDVALLTVEGEITITNQPTDVTECAGNGASFSVTATNAAISGTLMYQWQESTDGGLNYNNLFDNTTYNNVTTANLTITDVTGLNTNLYRALVSTGACAAEMSNFATLTVEGPLTITTQPMDMAACIGNSTNFSVVVNNPAAGTIIYQWQVSTDNGINFNNLNNNAIYDNVTTDVLTITDVTDLNTNQYRVEISSAACASNFSNAATLIEEGLISISSQPMDTTICAGNSTTFYVTANSGISGTLIYRWQVSTNGGGIYTNVPDNATYDDVTTATLMINNVLASFDNNLYRVKISTAACPAITSSSAKLTVEGPLTIISQPINTTECAGNDASFTVVVDNAASGTVLYQWQVLTNNNANYINVTDDATYDNVTSSTLVINDVLGLNGNQYRAVIRTATCAPQTSSSATLMVEGPITFTDHPMSTVVCEGNSTTFSAIAMNAGVGILTYQWQVRTGSGATFVNVVDDATYDNVTTTTLTINDVTNLDGYEYRLIASTANCDDVISNTAMLNTQNVDITTQPTDDTACSGSSVTFFVIANNSGVGALNYQWQMSTNNGANFSDILATDTNYTGAMSATLNVVDITNLNANQYRVLVSTSECAAVSSVTALLTVEGPIDITTQAMDQTVCENDSTSFNITATNNGAGTLVYQWQVSFDNGINYSNLVNNATYSGVDTPTLMISDVSTFDTYLYRALVATNSCMQPSDAATLTVEEQITISSHPQDSENCSGGAVTFSVITTGNNGSPINYIWEESTNNDTIFAPITDGGIYGGASTATLTINNTNGLNGKKYRAQVSSGTCPILLSNAAMLTVQGPLAIAAQPIDITVCDGAAVTFAAMVTNSGAGTLIYRWQFRNSNGGGFANVPNNAIYDDVNTPTLTINNTSGLDGFSYRLIAATSFCTTISTAATLSVDGPIVFVEHPQNTIACSNEMVSFSAFANFDGSGSVTYQWQVSTDNGSNFNDISVGSPYGGTNSTMLTINPIEGLGGHQYRLEASSTGCQDVYSNAATLTENVAPTANISSSNSVVCQNEIINLTATVTGASSPYTHIWEIVSPQPATFNGTGALMNEDMVTATFRGIQAGMIRLSYTTTSADGCEALSEFIDIEILTRPVVNHIAGNNTVCPTQTEIYTVFDNPNSTYQWTLVSGGTIVGANNNATVTIEWDAMTGGPHTLDLVERFGNNCSTENHIEVNIVDLGTPSFTCIGNQNFTVSEDNLLGDCQYEVTDNSLDITIDFEDCGIEEIVHNYNGGGTTLMGQAFPVGTTNVTWTVQDNAGNTATCTFSITVTDDEAPLFSTCSMNLVLNNDANNCSTVSAFNLPIATDNCSVTGIDNLSPNNPNTGQTYTSGDVFPVGTTTMLYRARDGEGNTNDCTFNITVNDTQNPTAICRNATRELNQAGTTVINAFNINNSSTDNCGINVFLLDISNFDCSNIGTNMVTMTIRDASGNEDMCTSIVTVEDNIAPSLTCPDDFIANACSIADAPPYTSYNSFQNVGGSASDNCTIDENTWTHISDVSDSGICPETVTRTYRIADESGNTGICEQRITVQDVQFPSIVVPSALTLSCDQSTAPAQTGTATVSDNCGSVTVTFQDQIFDSSCDNQYTIMRTWTAADLCGNSVSAGQQITLQDNDAPIFSTQASNLNIDCNDNNTDATTIINNWLMNNGGATAADNCGTVTFTNNYNGLSNACGVTGTANVTFTATDACGNSVTSTATISITDTQAPTWTNNPSNLTVECDDQNQLTTWLNNGGNGTVSDACGEVDIDFQITNQSNVCGQSSTITVNFIATDECGNSSTRTATANVEDTTAPLFDQTPPSLNDITCNQAFPSQTTLTATDNCGQVRVTETIDNYTATPCQAYTVTYRWMAEDDCDNQTIITRSFNVLPDTEAPNFVTFPNNITVNAEDLNSISEQGVEQYLANQNIIAPSVADDCGTATFTFTTNFSDNNVNCPTLALYNRIYTTTDDCGNSRNRTFEVTVVQNGTLAAICQPITVFLQNNIATITTADIDNGSSVACGNINLSISQSQFGQNNIGDNNVTLTVNDDNGNSATCNAVVTVQEVDADVSLAGNIGNEAGQSVGNTTVNWTVNGQALNAPITNSSGNYNLNVQSGDDVEIRPFKDINPGNGVSTFDLVLIHQHVLNINYLPSPYQRIAADANNDGVITTGDLIQIQALILNNISDFSNNTSWRFAVANPAVQNLPNPALVPDFEESLVYNNVNSDQLNGDFVAIKIGDVSGNAIANNFSETNEVENRSNEQVILQIDNSVFKNGITKDREYHMNITIQNFKPLLAYQLGLRFDHEALDFEGINATNLPNFKNSNIGLNDVNEGILRLNWWHQEAIQLADGSTLFTIVFKAKKDANRLETPVALDNEILQAEAYTADQKISSVILTYKKQQLNPTATTDQPLVLHQNRPNPFSSETIIGFYLPTASTAKLTILDAMGKIIKIYQGDYPQGFNEITVDLKDITTEGTLVYQLQTPNALASKFMIKVK